MPARDPLRIAMLTYATQPRGGVLHALALAEALQRAGDRVVLYAVDEPGAAFVREPECPYEILPVDRSRGDFYDFVRLSSDAFVAALEASDRFDVYHAHDGIGGDALATLADRGAAGGFARTVHHVTTFADPRVEAMQRRSIERATTVFVVSALWATYVHEQYGIDARQVGNGVDRTRFFPATTRPEPRANAPRFLTIGGIEDRKNTIALFDAFARVKRHVPEAFLVVAGGASVLDHSAYRRSFDERVARLGLREGIDYQIRGVLSDESIVALLQAADAFVFPSLVEGFGLVVLEALACGTPVVVSKREPFVEYLRPDDAVFVDPESPESIAAGMLDALQPSEALRLRARGPQIARGFSWDAIAAEHMAAYRA